jgi:hypothetical protein
LSRSLSGTLSPVSARGNSAIVAIDEPPIYEVGMIINAIGTAFDLCALSGRE